MGVFKNLTIDNLMPKKVQENLILESVSHFDYAELINVSEGEDHNIYTIEFDTPYETYHLRVVFCSEQRIGQVGIHVKDTEPYHLSDQIEVALRDGFHRIYVHSIDNDYVNEELNQIKEK